MSITPIILATLLPFGAGGSTLELHPDLPATRETPIPGLEAPPPRQTGWVFALVPFADLWFHGMATVDPVGPGPNPLYDPAYPVEMRGRKGAAGIGQTPLDQRAGYFRDAFRRDQAMEVLHFLPLYFAEAGRVEVFQALEALAVSRDGIPRTSSPNVRFGLTAVGSVLPAAGQRALLGEFVSVLEAEWDSFLSGDRRAELADREEARNAIQGLWDSEFGPALAPLLRGLHLTGGTVFLTPAIGDEGRIFSGSPSNPSDNVLAVAAPKAGGDPRAAVFSMLRELSFPMARQALEAGPEPLQDRESAEGVAARTAIRAGALALDRLLPSELPAYQQFFLSRVRRAPASAGATGAAFQEAYSLDESLLKALREVVNNTITSGGKE